MPEKLMFIVFCIEEYKSAEHLSGKAVIELFNRYGVIEYLSENFDGLHINGAKYLVEEINLFIEVRKNPTNE